MLEKPSKLSSAIIGGLIIGIVVGTPVLYVVNFCCCCGFIMLGGLISLYMYRKKFKDMDVLPESSDALILGIFSGIVGAFIGTALNIMLYFIFGHVTEKMLLKAINWMQTRGDVPAEYLDKLDTMSKEIENKIGQGVHLSDVFGNLAFNLIICPIFSMLGGLIGYGIFGKKKIGSQPTISA